MNECPVCEEPLTDDSPSPHWCCEQCQEVWQATQTVPPHAPAVDLLFVYGGRALYVHTRQQCAGPCPIHNPSNHPLRDRPLNWRDDRRIMERICPHGIGHPDPDDTAVRRDSWQGVHGCDGCCHGEVPK